MLCICCRDNLVKVNNNSKWVYYRCKKCGYWTSRTISGDLPKSDYIDLPTFDHNANDDWDGLVNEAKTIMRYKFQITNKSKVGRFLDIGCSEGVYVASCESLGWEAIGYEVDTAKVNRAQNRGLNVKGPKDFRIDKCSIDFILIRHVIEHVPDFIQLLQFTSKFLKLNGTMCVEIPNQAGIRTQFSRRSIKGGVFMGHVYPPEHIHAFEPKTLYYISDLLEMRCEKVLTYSPADPKWCFVSNYTKKGFIPLVHNIASKIGYGEEIAAFFKQKIY